MLEVSGSTSCCRLFGLLDVVLHAPSELKPRIPRNPRTTHLEIHIICDEELHILEVGSRLLQHQQRGVPSLEGDTAGAEEGLFVAIL